MLGNASCFVLRRLKNWAETQTPGPSSDVGVSPRDVAWLQSHNTKKKWLLPAETCMTDGWGVWVAATGLRWEAGGAKYPPTGWMVFAYDCSKAQIWVPYFHGFG